jgi:hypothetical protein
MLKRNLPNIAAVVLAAFLHIFSLWQLDLISVLPVWNTPLFLVVMQQQSVSVYSRAYFQCFIWKTTVGQAYDTLFMINFLSFWLLFLALWFWSEPALVVTEVPGSSRPPNPRSKLIKLAHVGVWFGFAIALAGSFEQALQASGSPIWSSIFGFPMLHHYLLGFVILGASLLILELKRGAFA